MRIAYLSGPADGPETYRQWASGDAQAYFGTDYMKQFLSFAQDDAYVVTWHGTERYVRKMGQFTFDNRPLPNASGALYFLAMLWWHLKLLPSLLRFKPDLFVLTGNQGFWWTLFPVRARLLPSFHCTLWPKAGLSLPWRVLLWLDTHLILKRCETAVCTSHAIGRQLRQVSSCEIFYHLPTYSPAQFADISPPEGPFRVLFMGRIEANKGIFDLIETARRLPYQFDVCGTGSALEEAKASAPPNVTFHGFCDQPRLKQLLSATHAVIAPTRSDFPAGFEMVCAEAILAGRPLIASSACPGLEYLRPASIEANTVDEYVAATESLAAGKRFDCDSLQGQFYDERNSWLTAMRRAVFNPERAYVQAEQLGYAF